MSVKIRVGSRGVYYGTIEATPRGLHLDGDEARLAQFIAAITMGEDPQDAPGGLDGFLRYCASPSVNNGYTNVLLVPADEEGEG